MNAHIARFSPLIVPISARRELLRTRTLYMRTVYTRIVYKRTRLFK